MKRNGLNKTQLQYIAVAAMVLDHASVFFRGTAVYYAMRTPGRMTIVIMSFFIAEGYYRTSNRNKYMIRMGAFAVISQLPFYLYEIAGSDPPQSALGFIHGCATSLNVIFTLFIALCMLAALRSERFSPALKAAAVTAAVMLTRHSDWRYYCLLWVAAFGLPRENRGMQLLAAAGISVFRFLMTVAPVFTGFAATRSVNMNQILWAFAQLGGLLALPLIAAYNGEKGNAPKRFFYIFYPAHLLLLAAIKFFVL